MRYSSSAHTRFYHRYHVVWSTKYRYKVLQGPMRERIREIIIQTCEELGVHIGFVAQMAFRSAFPFPQTDLPYGHGEGMPSAV